MTQILQSINDIEYQFVTEQTIDQVSQIVTEHFSQFEYIASRFEMPYDELYKLVFSCCALSITDQLSIVAVDPLQ